MSFSIAPLAPPPPLEHVDAQALLDLLADKLAEQHVFGPKRRVVLEGEEGLRPVPRALGMQCQLLARTLAEALMSGSVSGAVAEAVVTLVPLQEARGLVPWQAAFVRGLEANHLRLGGRPREPAKLVADVRTIAGSIPGAPPELVGNEHHDAELLALGRWSIRLERGSRACLTPIGLARLWSRRVGVAFPKEPRARKSSRRCGSPSERALPEPRSVSHIELTEPSVLPASRVPGFPVSPTADGFAIAPGEMVTTLAGTIHKSVVATVLTSPFVAEDVRAVKSDELPTVINALVRLMAVGYFTHASASHLTLARAIVERARSGASALDIEAATFLHLVGWAFDEQRSTEDAIDLVVEAIPHLVVPRGSELEAWSQLSRRHGLAVLRRLQSPFTRAREWAAQCGIGWPAQLQPSRGAARRRARDAGQRRAFGGRLVPLRRLRM